MIKKIYIQEMKPGRYTNDEILEILKEFLDKYPIISIHVDTEELKIEYMEDEDEIEVIDVKFNPSRRKD